MARNIVRGNSVSVAASKTHFEISEPFRPKDKLNLVVHVQLSDVVETNAITFQLLDSFDGGANWQIVGSEAQTAVTSQVCASGSDITHGTDTFAKTSHGFITGQPVIFKAGTAAPTGLTTATTYYIIAVDANSFKLAASQSDAYAGTVVNITGNGTGNQTFYPAVYQIRLIDQDSSDRAQMPLEDLVKVAATTGVSDTCTVSAVWIHDGA